MTIDEYILKRNTIFGQIASSGFEAYNYYHSGMDELVYEAGLVTELQMRGLRILRQQEFPIYYKDVPTCVHRRMDVVLQDDELGNIVLELKAIDRVGDVHRHQLWSYMKLMHMRLGMLLNFSPKGLYYEMYEYLDETRKCERINI